jgi:hypothetical protein
MSKRINEKLGILFYGILLVLVSTTVYTTNVQAEPIFKPIELHPENPHYFLWRGKPTILITSGEHYGAVLNRDFDYKKYFKTLESLGFNLTRTFSGAYCEPVGAFKIQNNTLAPAKNRLICPWARSEKPGYANGIRLISNASEILLAMHPDAVSWSNWYFSAPFTKMVCGNLVQ